MPELVIRIDLSSECFKGADNDEIDYKCRQEIASVLNEYISDLQGDFNVIKVLRDLKGSRIGTVRLES